MAIDKRKAKDLIDSVDSLFEFATKLMPREGRDFVKEKIMNPVLEEVRYLVEDSRPPVIFLMGRSGHGKSSFINALAKKQVSEVGDIKPTTVESEVYEIVFEERYANWQVIDTRGFFETTSPDGDIKEDVVEILKKDIVKYRPDIIIHIVAASEIRNLSKDIEAFTEISRAVEREYGLDVPTIVALNKVDVLGNPRDWPPEESSRKMGLIREAVDYMTKDILRAERYKQISIDTAARGYRIENNKYKAVVPISTLEGDLWNMEIISDIIGENIPDQAKLDFFQAQHRKDQLKALSSSLIDRFSVIAGTIGLSPVPVADILVLTPLQMLMIALIGGLSCREFKKETVFEYLAAFGINIGFGMGFRYLAQQLIKFIPGAGTVVSGAVASSGTYALGKSAEAYFFAGEVIVPQDFMDKEVKD